MILVVQDINHETEVRGSNNQIRSLFTLTRMRDKHYNKIFSLNHNPIKEKAVGLSYSLSICE